MPIAQVELTQQDTAFPVGSKSPPSFLNAIRGNPMAALRKTIVISDSEPEVHLYLSRYMLSNANLIHVFRFIYLYLETVTEIFFSIVDEW